VPPLGALGSQKGEEHVGLQVSVPGEVLKRLKETDRGGLADIPIAVHVQLLDDLEHGAVLGSIARLVERDNVTGKLAEMNVEQFFVVDGVADVLLPITADFVPLITNSTDLHSAPVAFHIRSVSASAFRRSPEHRDQEIP
jgi:hypothetical protein